MKIYLIEGLIIAILLIPLLVDAYVNTLKWISRIRIGRWEDIDLWGNSIGKICRKWSGKTPTVKITDNNRGILWDIVNGKYRSQNIQSWQKGQLLLATRDNRKIKSLINEKTGNWIEKPKEIDSAFLAYAILSISENQDNIKPAMDTIRTLIFDRIQDNDGCISYREKDHFIRYVDTVGLACPFLALYGTIYHDDESVVLAEHQLEEYYRYGIWKKSGLFAHAVNIKSGLPLGNIGWGRGCGWYLLGLIETAIILNENNLWKKAYYLAEKYKDYQNTDGSYCSNLAFGGSKDSSITAIMAYYYIICAKYFSKEDYKDTAEKSVYYLMSVTRRNGIIDFSQGDTKGIGNYSTCYDQMPFTQGIAYRAYKLLKE